MGDLNKNGLSQAPIIPVSCQASETLRTPFWLLPLSKLLQLQLLPARRSPSQPHEPPCQRRAPSPPPPLKRGSCLGRNLSTNLPRRRAVFRNLPFHLLHLNLREPIPTRLHELPCTVAEGSLPKRRHNELTSILVATRSAIRCVPNAPSKRPPPQNQKGLFHNLMNHFRMSVKRYFFCSMSGSFIYRCHVEPRVKRHSPREESFPVPLQYIDASRTTHTHLDVKQEKCKQYTSNTAKFYEKWPRQKQQENNKYNKSDKVAKNHCPIWKTQSFLLNAICVVVLWCQQYISQQQILCNLASTKRRTIT